MVATVVIRLVILKLANAFRLIIPHSSNAANNVADFLMSGMLKGDLILQTVF